MTFGQGLIVHGFLESKQAHTREVGMLFLGGKRRNNEHLIISARTIINNLKGVIQI